MALPVVIVASGGYPMNRLSAHGGLPVTLAAQGLAVTEAPAGYGLPVTFVTEGGSVVLPVPPVTYATWDAATVTAVMLSGGNLIATNTGTTASEQGAKSATGKTSGKYYFEMTFTSITNVPTRRVVGIGPPASTYSSVSISATAGSIVNVNGIISSNGVGSIVDLNPGTFAPGAVVGMAIDLDNRRAWFRQSPSGLWNNSATANPATNTEGVTIPVGTMVPYCTFGGTTGAAGDVTTANFGASAFSGVVPSGFTAGWPT